MDAGRANSRLKGGNCLSIPCDRFVTGLVPQCGGREFDPPTSILDSTTYGRLEGLPLFFCDRFVNGIEDQSLDRKTCPFAGRVSVSESERSITKASLRLHHRLRLDEQRPHKTHGQHEFNNNRRPGVQRQPQRTVQTESGG